MHFILFCDGPCNESAWRVGANADKSQWWSRHDAIVRTAAAALWQCPAQSYVKSKSMNIFFSDIEKPQQKVSNISNTVSNAVISIWPGIVSEIAVPTESGVLAAFRRSCAAAEKSKSGSHVGANISCRYYKYSPCEEVGTSHKQADTSPLIASMDKRQLLRHLKSFCTRDFLVTHSLSGSEDLVLKKKNKQHLLIVYDEWLSQSSDNSKKVQEDTSSNRDRGFVELVEVFRQIFLSTRYRNNVKSNSHSNPNPNPNPNQQSSFASAYLLLLHEDYPCELEVFSPDDGDQKDGRSSENEEPQVFCALGCVRDASDLETAAILSAAKSLNIVCVGANLGRTAEFTSKIITSLHAHAMGGRLASAVAKLSVIDASSRTLLLKQVSLRDSNNKAKQQQLSSPLEAATMEQSTHSTCKKRPLEVLESSIGAYKHNICHDFRVVIWLPILHTDITVDLNLRERLHGIVQLLVCTLWRSRLAKEQQQKIQQSELSKHKSNMEAAEDGNEVSATTTATTTTAITAGTKANSFDIVSPTLFIVFRDDSVATLTQEKLVLAMAALHMAAPSEYQVLTMLIHLLQSSEVVQPAEVRVKDSPMENLIGRFLPTNRDAKIRVVNLKGISRICHNSSSGSSSSSSSRSYRSSSNSSSIGSSSSSSSSSSSVGGSSQDTISSGLAEFAYNDHCSCSHHHGAAELVEPDHVTLLVLMGNGNVHSSTWRTVITDAIYRWKWHVLDGDSADNKVVSQTKLSKRYRKLSRMIFSGPLYSHGVDSGNHPTHILHSSGGLSPAVAVTILQHWAYHHRLLPAVDQAIRTVNNSSGNSGVGGGSNNSDVS